MKNNWMVKKNNKSKRIALGLVALALALLLTSPALALEGEQVRAAQERLVQLGFLEGEPDGVYGDRTVMALERLAVYAESVGHALSGDALTDALIAGQIPLAGALTQIGDVSETVMRVQRRLRTLSYLSDKADGRYGDNTQRAVLLFQEAAGLTLTGAADADTQARLFDGNAPEAVYPVLAKGMKGDRVLDMQNRLATLGFFIGRCDADYGADTVLGVKAFQTYVHTSGHYDQLNAMLRVGNLNGLADPLVLSLLYADDFPMPGPLEQGSSGQEVYRLQRRLIALTYLSGNPDGGYGEGTASAVAAFQKRNGLKGTGKANGDTLERLFRGDALEPVKPYKLVADLSDQKLYVYALDKSGGYGKLTYTMRCSTGPLAKEGAYAALTGPAEAKWTLVGGKWVRYPFMLGGTLMIHSIPHTEKQGDVEIDALSALGTPADAGGVLLSVEDARLIYEKCPRHTPVEIVM